MSTVWGPGRNRWRLTLHRRTFTAQSEGFTMLAELFGARNVRLEQQHNGPAQLSFTMTADDPEAAEIVELQTEVFAWRYDEISGRDVAMFRGYVSASNEEATANADTVNFTCWDYLRILDRRKITTPARFDQVEQDHIATWLLDVATTNARDSGGGSFFPGSFLPVRTWGVDADGDLRGPTGRLRDRTYERSTTVGEALANLAEAIDGFDYDLVPARHFTSVHVPDMDLLRLWYPTRGMLRDEPLIFGLNLVGFGRTVNAADYANYWMVLGQQQTEQDIEEHGEQVRFAEAWNVDANNITQVPVGLWASGDSMADVTQVSTLQERADGNLARSEVALPSWRLTLAPDVYRFDNLRIGDLHPLIIKTALRDVDTSVRIVARTFSIDDTGEETVEIACGRPDVTYADIFAQRDRRVDALIRRSL